MNSGTVFTLPERRAAAAARFRASELPTRRDEAWKYSDLKSGLYGIEMNEVPARWAVGPLPEGVEAFDLSGNNAPEWARARFGTLAGNAVSAASFAFGSGVALRVRGAVREPLTLEFSGRGHVRALLVLEDGASLTLVERAEPDLVCNAAIEIVLSAGAVLDHVRLAPVALGAVLLEEIAMRVAARAVYRGHFANFGAHLSRIELNIVLEGEGAEAHLSGVSVLAGDSRSDVTTHVTHAVGGTRSTQLFKMAGIGRSDAIYQGKVTVAEGADGADSRQTAKALLLNEWAMANLKPELEIFADDVKCAHGAAVGDLDANSLFYLRARGIPETQARSLLTHAFLEDALAAIAREDVRAQVAAAVHDALAEMGQ